MSRDKRSDQSPGKQQTTDVHGKNARFWQKVGQIVTKWDTSGTFKDQTSENALKI